MRALFIEIPIKEQGARNYFSKNLGFLDISDKDRAQLAIPASWVGSKNIAKYLATFCRRLCSVDFKKSNLKVYWCDSDFVDFFAPDNPPAPFKNLTEYWRQCDLETTKLVRRRKKARPSKNH